MVENYTLVVAITASHPLTIIKEYLDIAVVHASYGGMTAIYLDPQVVKIIDTADDPVLKQLLNIAQEFSVSIFSERAIDLYDKPLSVIALSTLSKYCQHVLTF